MNSDKYQKYFNEYSDYSNKYLGSSRYLAEGKRIITTKYYQILRYEKYQTIYSDKKFLVIPSIFNSPEILFLGRNKGFIDNLRGYGEVLLIDWFEVLEADYSLNDYVQRIAEIITNLNFTNLNIIGHCIGGNLAIASSIIAPNSIETITLLTTPWDFSHLANIHKIYQRFNIEQHIRNLPIVPKIYIQILFFLLSPNYFDNKVDRFFKLTSNKDKDLSFKIERWLLSGFALPQATYRQIMDDLIEQNILVNNKWTISGKIINPELINKPIYQIIANNDHLVPKSSILPLLTSFKNSTIFEVEGGHISYLINDKISNLFKRYM